ncbi:MAG TPA: DsbA family protein [Candidatus Limnocylindria bacterium]|nr:DsbA family protein [Candidatus Limnocylindria bacterium]
MPGAIEFWFEFASTYSYPAALRVEALARGAGVTLTWRPFLLGLIFGAHGWRDSPFNIYPAKGRYMWRDLERTCARLGVPFKKPSQFPRTDQAAALGIFGAPMLRVGDEFFWGNDRVEEAIAWAASGR